MERGEEHIVKSPECMLVRKSSFHSMVFISLGMTDVKDRPRQGVEGKKQLKQTKGGMTTARSKAGAKRSYVREAFLRENA